MGKSDWMEGEGRERPFVCIMITFLSSSSLSVTEMVSS
jgi:hypothetical protein